MDIRCVDGRSLPYRSGGETGVFGWTDVRESAEVEVFCGSAIGVRLTGSDGSESHRLQGIRSETGEVFLLGFGAPTDEFLPTWTAMFDSITATG
jgi:hypothetical protein